MYRPQAPWTHQDFLTISIIFVSNRADLVLSSAGSVARLLLIEHRQAVDRRDSYVQHTQIDANFPTMMDEIIDNAIT